MSRELEERGGGGESAAPRPNVARLLKMGRDETARPTKNEKKGNITVTQQQQRRPPPVTVEDYHSPPPSPTLPPADLPDKLPSSPRPHFQPAAHPPLANKKTGALAAEDYNDDGGGACSDSGYSSRNTTPAGSPRGAAFSGQRSRADVEGIAGGPAARGGLAAAKPRVKASQPRIGLGVDVAEDFSSDGERRTTSRVPEAERAGVFGVTGHRRSASTGVGDALPQDAAQSGVGTDVHEAGHAASCRECAWAAQEWARRGAAVAAAETIRGEAEMRPRGAPGEQWREDWRRPLALPCRHCYRFVGAPNGFAFQTEAPPLRPLSPHLLPFRPYPYPRPPPRRFGPPAHLVSVMPAPGMLAAWPRRVDARTFVRYPIYSTPAPAPVSAPTPAPRAIASAGVGPAVQYGGRVCAGCVVEMRAAQGAGRGGWYEGYCSEHDGEPRRVEPGGRGEESGEGESENEGRQRALALASASPVRRAEGGSGQGE